MNNFKKELHNEAHAHTAADRSISRSINREVLLDIIRKSNGIFKAALAKQLGLTKPAVARVVADLINMGLVEEQGYGNSGKNGGGRPMMLHFNDKFKYIGALDLSLHEPACAIGTMSHHTIGLKKIKISKYASVEDKREHITEAFSSIMQENSISKNELGCIVISHPGIIGADGEPAYTVEQFRAWTQIDIKYHLEKEFDIPIVLENDVRCAAIGEMQVGLQGKLSNLLYVSCGMGLASSIIINGKLYEGINRASGEMGSTLDGEGRRREDTVAMNGLIEHLQRLLASAGRKEELDFSKIVELAAEGDAIINWGIRDIGRDIGRIIYNTAVILDIPTIIFGGDYLKLGQSIFDGMEDAIPQTHYLPRPQIVKSTVMESAGIFGGFVLGTNIIIRQTLADFSVMRNGANCSLDNAAAK